MSKLFKYLMLLVAFGAGLELLAAGGCEQADDCFVPGACIAHDEFGLGICVLGNGSVCQFDTDCQDKQGECIDNVCVY